MISKKFLAQNKELFEKNLEKRGITSEYGFFESIYYELKKITQEQEQLRAKQNNIKEQNEEASQLKQKIAILNNEKQELETKLDAWLLQQPNILDSEVPIGKSEKENKIILECKIPNTKKTYLPHDEILEKFILKEEASKISGSRFIVLTKELAQLQRALVQFMMEENAAVGYEEYTIPYLVNESSMYRVGQLPKFAQDAFCTTDKKWLISTGEVGLVNLFADKIFKEEELPKLCMTFSPCFRSEAGSAGKDTKGLIRLHQFHKVELVTICTANQSKELHEKQLITAQNILKKLKIPYQILLLCSADTAFTAAKQYDIEIWLPGMNRFLEIASCSNCETFQAIRANIRCKTNSGLEFAHTLNGSSLPIERLIAAIAENYYDHENRSINIPQILHKYLSFKKIIIR